MSGPPPENLMDWSKKMLVREVERLRAIVREHSEVVSDSPSSGGEMVDVAGDPHAHGGVILDVRQAVLMDALDVSLVDTKQGEEPAMAMVLKGRVNYSTRRTRQMFLFGADGAAGLVSQVAGLAGRAGGAFGGEFRAAFEERWRDMP